MSAIPTYVGVGFPDDTEQDTAGFSPDNLPVIDADTTGVLPIDRGGTGQTTAAAALAALGGTSGSRSYSSSFLLMGS